MRFEHWGEDVSGAGSCFWSAALGARLFSALCDSAVMISQRDRKKTGKGAWVSKHTEIRFTAIKGKDLSKVTSGKMQIMSNLLIKEKARKLTVSNFINNRAYRISLLSVYSKGKKNRIPKRYLHSHRLLQPH